MLTTEFRYLQKDVIIVFTEFWSRVRKITFASTEDVGNSSSLPRREDHINMSSNIQESAN